MAVTYFIRNNQNEALFTMGKSGGKEEKYMSWYRLTIYEYITEACH